MENDAAAARALIHGHFAGTRYEHRLLELVESAVSGGEEELLIADGGFLISSAVDGAMDVVRIQGLAGSDAALDVLIRDLLRKRARIVHAELPDDLPFARAASALERAGFSEESNVADFVDDGIGLRILTMRPTAT